MREKENAAGGCLLADNVWKFLWDPGSGVYYLPSIIRDGLDQAGIKIPPFATVAVPDTSIPLIKLSFNLHQSTLSGLAAVRPAGFQCKDGGEVTALVLGLRFDQLSFRGRYSVTLASTLQESRDAGAALREAITLVDALAAGHGEPGEPDAVPGEEPSPAQPGKPVLEGLFFDDALGVTVRLEARLDYASGPVRVEIPQIAAEVQDLKILLKRTSGDETLFTRLQTWVANLWIVKTILKKALAAGLNAQPVRQALAKAIQAGIDHIGAPPLHSARGERHEA